MENHSSQTSLSKPQAELGFSDILGYFSNDKTLVYTLQKAQKLASALYLITGFFADNEPLKWKLRSLASTLIETSLSHKGQTTNSDLVTTEIRTLVLEISSFLMVAKQAGLVSEMNHAIISKEFILFSQALTPSANFKETGNRELRNDFFTIPTEKPSVPEAKQVEEKNEMSFMPTTPAQPAVSRDILPSRTETRPAPVMDTRISESTLAHTDKPKTESSKPLKDFGVVAVKKNSRQSIIIGLLKRKKEVMIKDISPLIQGCSEKTIQRELLSMVEAGVLKKIGEKRWSRYSLAIEA